MTQPTLFEPASVVRRPRRMPSMRAIEAYHGIEHGVCFRCREYRRCERAHVVDHVYGGPDTVDNLVPLCYPCHDAMPPFRLEEERYAWAWLRCDAETYFRWRWETESRASHLERFGTVVVGELVNEPGFFERAFLYCWPHGPGGEYRDLSAARALHLAEDREAA